MGIRIISQLVKSVKVIVEWVGARMVAHQNGTNSGSLWCARRHLLALPPMSVPPSTRAIVLSVDVVLQEVIYKLEQLRISGTISFCVS